MAEKEDRLEIGEKVRVIGTGLLGRVSEPYANDVGYRVRGYDEGPWDGEYSADELKRLTPPRFRVGQHLLYTQEDGNCVVTVNQRRFDTTLNCWFYQFAADGPWLSETEDLHSFPQPQFNPGDKVLLRDNLSADDKYTATIVKPSFLRGQPSYEIELDCNKEHHNWLADDVLPLSTKETLNITQYLTNCEGETFFSLVEGEVTFHHLEEDKTAWFIKKNGDTIGIPVEDILFPNSGVAHLYPNKECLADNLFKPREAWEKFYKERPTFSVVVNIAEYEGQDVINDSHESLAREFPSRTKAKEFVNNLIKQLKNQIIMSNQFNEANKKIWDDHFNAVPPEGDGKTMELNDAGEYVPATPIGYDEEQKLYGAIRNILEEAIKHHKYKTYRVGEVFVDTYHENHEKIVPFDVIYLFSREWEDMLFPVVVRTITEKKMSVYYLGGEENEDVITETIECR